ncbi:O-antigen ligase family protein [Rhodococcus kroppenstedtii]|uniref:O-antigen ligase family protein n=1 Tax=Rhodococcoides kroppenstedtii TaxID=293050 RepID=UPI001C9A96EB|nr:O-antigen ligase family protein [Rhodococcus kroppenstedtii]MBY6437559.1 O-antigen ligase family protein [Rhodococcus kroppenstedtii]
MTTVARKTGAPFPYAPVRVEQQRLVAGTLAVALLIAGTRWGSYTGASGLYLTDMLLAAGITHHLLWVSGRSQPSLTGYTRRASPGIAFWALATYVVARITASISAFDAEWVRDAVPFLYALVGLVAASSIARSTEFSRERTMRVLWFALLFHLIWTTIVIRFQINPAGLPSFPGAPISIGQVRPDIDCAILGVTAALFVRNIFLKRTPWWSLVALVITSQTIAGMSTRGGYLAIAIAVLLGMALTYFALRDRISLGRPAMALVLVSIAIAAYFVLPSTVIGKRFIATFDSSQASTSEAQNAVGTARARDMAWEMVIDWTGETRGRQVFGAGPGPNFIVEAGASAVLQGTEYRNVRSPHNFFIGLYARFGAVGLTLVSVVMLLTAWRIWENRVRIGKDELLFTCALLAAAIVPVAAVGVVLESPFGAIPFWWAVGILLTLGGVKAVRR